MWGKKISLFKVLTVFSMATFSNGFFTIDDQTIDKQSATKEEAAESKPMSDKQKPLPDQKTQADTLLKDFIKSLEIERRLKTVENWLKSTKKEISINGYGLVGGVCVATIAIFTACFGLVKNHRLKKQNIDLTQHVSSLQKDNGILRGTNQTLTGDNGILRGTNETLQRANETLKREKESLKSDSEKLSKLYQTLCLEVYEERMNRFLGYSQRSPLVMLENIDANIREALQEVPTLEELLRTQSSSMEVVPADD